MSSSRKAAKNAKSKTTANKVMARSSAKEKTKSGKAGKTTSTKEDAKKALKLKAGTATSSKVGAKGDNSQGIGQGAGGGYRQGFDGYQGFER